MNFGKIIIATARSKNGNYHLMPHIQRTPMNVRIALISYKLESPRYISAADSTFIKILLMGSKRQAHNVTK